MSYLIIKYKKSLELPTKKCFSEIEKELVDLTAKLFNKKPEEIIADFEPFSTYCGKRDVVVRAETSLKNCEMLESWSEGIKSVFENSELRNIVVGIKTYSFDSYWQEIELK